MITIGPVLLGLPLKEAASAEDKKGISSPASDDGSWKELPRHRDEDQVQLDVNRAFIYYPNRMYPRALIGEVPWCLCHHQTSALIRVSHFGRPKRSRAESPKS